MIGEKAPPFTLPAVDGETYSLAGAAGKIVVIHFATTWCPFCNAEAPHLEQLFREYRDKGVMVYIVDVKEEKKLVDKLVDRFRFSFPVLRETRGPSSKASTQFGNGRFQIFFRTSSRETSERWSVASQLRPMNFLNPILSLWARKWPGS